MKVIAIAYQTMRLAGHPGLRIQGGGYPGDHRSVRDPVCLRSHRRPAGPDDAVLHNAADLDGQVRS